MRRAVALSGGDPGVGGRSARFKSSDAGDLVDGAALVGAVSYDYKPSERRDAPASNGGDDGQCVDCAALPAGSDQQHAGARRWAALEHC